MRTANQRGDQERVQSPTRRMVVALGVRRSLAFALPALVVAASVPLGRPARLVLVAGALVAAGAVTAWPLVGLTRLRDVTVTPDRITTLSRGFGLVGPHRRRHRFTSVETVEVEQLELRDGPLLWKSKADGEWRVLRSYANYGFEQWRDVLAPTGLHLSCRNEIGTWRGKASRTGYKVVVVRPPQGRTRLLAVTWGPQRDPIESTLDWTSDGGARVVLEGTAERPETHNAGRFFLESADGFPRGRYFQRRPARSRG